MQLSRGSRMRLRISLLKTELKVKLRLMHEMSVWAVVNERRLLDAHGVMLLFES